MRQLPGAKAIYDALTLPFIDNKPQMIFAGHNLDRIPCLAKTKSYEDNP